MILCINLKVMLFILDYIFIICTWFGESAVMFRQPTLVPVLPSSGNTWQCIFQECSKPEFLLVLREAVKIPLMQVDVCPCLHKWVCIFEALRSTFAACQFFSLSSLFLMKNARTECFIYKRKAFVLVWLCLLRVCLVPVFQTGDLERRSMLGKQPSFRHG